MAGTTTFTFEAAAPEAVFVSVTVLGPPVMLPVGAVIRSGFGVIVSVARFATPVPVKVTGVPVPVAVV